MWEKITRAAHVTMQCREGGGGREEKNSNVRGACRSPVTRFTPTTMYVWWWFPHMIPEKFLFFVFFFFLIFLWFRFGSSFIYIFMIVIVSRHFLVISFLSLCVCVIHYGKLVRETIWLLIMCSIFLGSFFIELMGRHVKNPLARSRQLSSAFWYSSILLLESIAVPLF